MASKVVGSIVATNTETNLKTVFHVHKDGGSVTFKNPDNASWSHLCHPSNEKNKAGWEKEVNMLGGGFSDATFYPQ